MNNDFIIITDTGCDLDLDYLNKNNVMLMKLGYSIDNIDYEGNDGKVLDVKEFYKILEDHNLLFVDGELIENCSQLECM